MALNIDLWSTTPNSNASLDGVSVAENCPYANWNNAMRSMQAAIRQELMDIGTTVTAATLTTISGLSKRQPLGGSTTIDGFATAVTGMYRELPVINAPMLRNSATLALPDSIDRRLIAGDLIKATSLGAGSWVVKIDRQQEQEASATITAASVMDITVAKPFAQVSGNTTIDGFTTAVTGMGRELQLLGTPLLKNSSGLALQGSANFQGAAGDMLHARSLGAGNWVVTAEKKSGLPTVISAVVAATGASVQEVSTVTGTVATGTTAIPYDNTIPQITEGDEYMTLAITPTSATNKLKIEVVFNGANANATARVIAALFQDATAGALAAGCMELSATGHAANIKIVYWMTAGTISSTTFRVRAGGSVAASTTTFNGFGGTQLFGGVMASSITITEYKV